MAHRIVSVDPDGIAAQCGIEPGDTLLSINGEPVLDQVDYQYLSAASCLVLEVQDARGVAEIELEKDEDEPLGLTFESTLMSRPRSCANKCVFCFIDQMPCGMRDTLYVKDDDWRLSLMMGNYITLTNVSDAEFDRIIARRASPLYLSIHAIDGDLRARMMGNPHASRIAEQLRRLKDSGISFHCQIVLCPGLNDGAALDETLTALSALYPAAKSTALVPVGLTRHRDGLAQLTPYHKQTAAALLAQAHAWQQKLFAQIGTRFVFPADEFYCLSGETPPDDDAYEGYPQIENGVGLLRSFETEFTSAHSFLDESEICPRWVLIATGVSAAPFLRELIAAHPLPGVKAEVLAVENRFFGPSVTVAGLLTGQDLIAALAGKQADEILISQAMLRHEDGLFLDGLSLGKVAENLSAPLHPVVCDGAEFLYALAGEQFGMEA